MVQNKDRAFIIHKPTFLFLGDPYPLWHTVVVSRFCGSRSVQCVNRVDSAMQTGTVSLGRPVGQIWFPRGRLPMPRSVHQVSFKGSEERVHCAGALCDGHGHGWIPLGRNYLCQKLRNPYFCHIFGMERQFFFWKKGMHQPGLGF